MTRRDLKHSRRSGVTLIELLVVATIMLTIAAVSVPTIKPMMESQVTSHAARTVSTYLERAKARAITTGRSCGVTFEYFPGTYNGDEHNPLGSASLVLRQVEEPPLYCGLDFGSRVSVCPNFGCLILNNVDSPYHGQRVNQVFGDGSVFDPMHEWESFGLKDQTFEPRIQFNSIGPFYPLVYINDGFYIVKIPGAELPVHNHASYKISMAPTATMTSPVGLDQGTVVDLEFSGTDSNAFAKGQDITVMFSPSGEVDYIMEGRNQRTPAGTLYFLIGRWDRLSALGVSDDGFETLAEDGLWNFEDGSNFWVTINPQTGVVSTTEVNQPFNYTLGGFSEGVKESREFARYSKRNIGGR